MRKNIAAVLLLILCLNFPAMGQQVRPMSSSEIYLKLQQLGNLGTVMYFAAHPDDENTRLIAYLVHHDHVRTIYYSLTRGDGGQNILGNEQGPVLGLIRTHELLQARALDGAEQMFSPFVDFGYTTSVPETFSFWNRQKLVQDAVKAIQDTKPDLIICRFPTTGEGGHGQHTVSAIVAKDAWEYIQHYNDTTKGEKLWLPKRELFNSFQFGTVNTVKPGQFKLEINQYDPLLGEGLGELAGKSRSEHKSQGAGTPQIVGVTPEHFQLIDGSPLQNSLYDGVDTTWNRIGHPEIGKQIETLASHFNFTDPSRNLPSLITILKAIKQLPDGFWKNQKLKEINQIILSCAGVMAEAVTPKPMAVPGDTLGLDLHLISRGGKTPVRIKEVDASCQILVCSVAPGLMKSDSLYNFPMGVYISDTQPVTQPYWLEVPPVNNEFQFDHQYLGMPEAPNKLTVSVLISIGDQDFPVQIPISNKKLDPVRGDVTQRLRIVPAISIEPVSNLLIYNEGQDKDVVLHLKAFQKVVGAQLNINYGSSILKQVDLPTLSEGLDTFMTFSIPGNKLNSDLKSGNFLHFVVRVGKKNFSKAVHLIDYTHIPELQYLTTAEMKLVPTNWKVAVHKIGYVEGVGDFVDDVLRLCNLEVETIPELQLNNPDYLKQYDAIVIGIRALNTKKSLKAGMDGLLQYVQKGGTLIVQYNKSQDLVTAELGPYPIELVYDRVTDEQAPVKFLEPSSPLLNYPNKITSDDFDQWIQERGLYFPGKWDKAHYQTPLAMHDQGKPELDGAILYTPYGKGNYIYTSLAFFRQLPDGNEGAIRLFMNLLSVGTLHQ